ncbi:hypothetical protein Vretifemale_10851 [Volvox reticuliferus]|uniref:Uncharacterized protein n=1 Tax=Volvox reticuliferus TaxID=1737510 RepID=A0A8J4CG78_9CHLO|nr:hypothetical protein Vretifemale_10851 [Volvox reticuliferus]
MADELEVRLLAQEDLCWEPDEACSAPEEDSDESDAPAARPPRTSRGSYDLGLPRKRRRRPIWTRQEEAVFARQHCIHGNSWSAIAEHLPGRSAPEVKNIWHSTLRSKKFIARSLLRAYALEVQERGDSTEARMEAYRAAVRRTGGHDNADPDSIDPEYATYHNARRSAGSDGNDGDPAGPRRNVQWRRAYKEEAYTKRRRPAGSSEDEDAASLTSDPTPPQHAALRNEHLVSQPVRSQASDPRVAAVFQIGSYPGTLQQRGRDPRTRLPDFMLGGGVVSNTRAQHRNFHQLPDNPDSLGRDFYDGDGDHVAAAALAGGGPTVARPGVLPLEARAAMLQQLAQQQQLQRLWPDLATAPYNPPRFKGERQGDAGGGRQGPAGGGAHWLSGDGEFPGDEEGSWHHMDTSRGGDPHGIADAGSGAVGIDAMRMSGEELARLQMMMMMQSALERGPPGLTEATAAAGPAAWLPPLPAVANLGSAAGLTQMLAQLQWLAQAQASMEAEEVHRLALLRHQLELQLPQARHLAGGPAAAADFGEDLLNEENGDSPNGAWRMKEVGAGGSASGGLHRNAEGNSSANQAADVFGGQVPLPHLPPLGPIGPLAAAAMASAAAAAASGGAPALNAYALVPPQQHLAASLEQLSALPGAGGLAERMLGAHAKGAAASRAAIAEAALAAAAFAPPGLFPAAVAGPWETAPGGVEVQDGGAATGPSSADTLTGVGNLQTPEETGHADGEHRGSHTAVSSAAGGGGGGSRGAPRVRAGSKRRGEIRGASGSAGGPKRFTAATRPPGALGMLPLAFLDGGMVDGAGGLYGLCGPFEDVSLSGRAAASFGEVEGFGAMSSAAAAILHGARSGVPGGFRGPGGRWNVRGVASEDGVGTPGGGGGWHYEERDGKRGAAPNRKSVRRRAGARAAPSAESSAAATATAAAAAKGKAGRSGG